MLSQTVEYALRALLYIAQQAPRYVPVAEAATAVDAPRNYLGKVLSQLTREGFLKSTRGPSGGFRLAAGARIRSLSVLTTLSGTPRPRRCLLGTGPCGEDRHCVVHARWAPVMTASADFFATTTLDDLLHSREALTTPPSSGASTSLLSNH
jgi:Rrf2 family protein